MKSSTFVPNFETIVLSPNEPRAYLAPHFGLLFELVIPTRSKPTWPAPNRLAL